MFLRYNKLLVAGPFTKVKSDFTILNIFNEVCLPFLDPIMLNCNGFNYDDAVEIKVIVERHRLIAGHLGTLEKNVF